LNAEKTNAEKTNAEKTNAEKPSRSSVELLAKHHDVSAFDCRKHESLNDWLKRFALLGNQSDSARTYVVHRDSRVVGYFSLCSGSVSREESTRRVAKRQPAYPIGIILLARLAVDHTEQGQGLGKALLKDALLRASHAADIIAARAVLVHAIDGEAKNFYRHFDFEACPLNDLHLMLLMKDLRAQIKPVKSDDSWTGIR
jgi:GNAT superfamily N-acetyltransferase